MAAAELAPLPVTVPTSLALGAHPRFRRIALVVLGLLAVTALGAGAELVDPTLFRSTPPHPTLTPTAGAIAAILATNLRVLAAPFLLIGFRFASCRRAAVLGDVILGAILIANALHVGLALGRWHARLLPYLPHLPIEYLATAVAGAAWLNARRQPDQPYLEALRASVGYAAAVLVLLAAAATAEVLLTPHRS